MTTQETALNSSSGQTNSGGVAASVHRTTATLLLIVAGLAAGYSAAVAIERVHGQDNYYQFPEEVSAKFPPMGQPIPEEILQLKDHTNRMLDYKNTAISLAMFGAVVTGLFGLAIGIARRRILPPILGLLMGVGLGALFGAAAGGAEVFVGQKLQATAVDEMLSVMLKHASAWMTIAVGIGLTVGLTCGGFRHCGRSIGAAMLGGAIAAMIYAPASAILFATEKSEQFVPTGMWARTVWMSSSGVLMALLLAWVIPRSATPASAQKERPSAE